MNNVVTTDQAAVTPVLTPDLNVGEIKSSNGTPPGEVIQAESSRNTGSSTGSSTDRSTDRSTGRRTYKRTDRRRVVVTGMGIICPTGNTVEEAWANAAAGKTGIANITRFDTSHLEVHFGGEVKNFDAENFLGRREARRADRVTHLALYAADQALKDSGIPVTDENRFRIGVIVGSGIGGIQSLFDSIKQFIERGAKGVSPLMVPMMLPDAASARIAMTHGLRGPNFAISTACATGNNSIGEAVEIIRRGQADAALAGSTEAGLVDVALASFNNMTAISRRNDAPEKASRPYDRDRDGFVVSEGAGILVLEALEHAQARGATIYAEMLGYGHTDDAYHVTAPMETGEGAVQAMLDALADAGISPDDIDYINAHGTGTALNDKSETLAMKRALGEQAYAIPISSTKSVTGHLMGGAGAIEAVFSVMAIQNNFVPPTVNLDNPDPECDLNYTPHVGKAHPIDIVMSNSFGFGGHNAVLIFGRYHPEGIVQARHATRDGRENRNGATGAPAASTSLQNGAHPQSDERSGNGQHNDHLRNGSARDDQSSTAEPDAGERR